MKKLLLLVLFIPSLAFAQDVSTGSLLKPQSEITIVVGADEYTRDLPDNLSDSQELNVRLTDLLNQLIVEYISSSEDNKSKIEDILASSDKVVKDVKTVEPITIIKEVKVDTTKFLALGGFVQLNPLGLTNLSGGAQVTINIFKTLLLTGGLGLQVSTSSITPQVSVNLAYWMF